MNYMTKQRTFVDRCFKDKNGQVVLAQNPNWPLIVWLVSAVASIVLHGKLLDACQIIGFLALLIWSLLEIIQGINYFRRLLGFVVLCLAFLAAFDGDGFLRLLL
jgi:hypothetical protein